MADVPQLVMIAGPNGSGKSTLIAALRADGLVETRQGSPQVIAQCPMLPLRLERQSKVCEGTDVIWGCLDEIGVASARHR